MRKWVYLILGFTLFFDSCKKDDNTLPPSGAGSLVCKINGTDWAANSTLVASKGSTLNINGSNLNGSSFSIILTDLDTGNYSINADRNKFIYTESGASYLSTNSNPGSLRISSHDLARKQIQGSFSFAARSGIGATKTVSQGNFTILYSN